MPTGLLDWNMRSSHPVRRPRGFSEIELGSLSVWFIGAGRWRFVGLSEGEAQDLLQHFFRCLVGVKEDALNATCLSLQNRFMAMRRGSFEATQSEPPFSRRARRNMKELLDAWLDGEAQFAQQWNETFCPGWDQKGSPEQPVRVIPASGESTDSAVQILTNDPEDKVNAIYWYLYYQFGQDWERGLQTTTGPDAQGHGYDVLEIQFSGGQSKNFHFRF